MIRMGKNLEKTKLINYVDILNVIVSVVGITIAIVCMLDGLEQSEGKYKFITYGVIICLVILFMNIYCILNKRREIKDAINIKKLEEKNKNLLEVTDNVRCFKHDFYNIMQAINGYIDVKDINALQKYFECLSKECHHINILDSLNYQVTENPAIYSILKDKYEKASSSNITMNIDILMALNNLEEKSYEISRILGILLDNAIEATNECNEKIINVRFLKEENRNRDLIIIENTYKDKNVDINRIFEKNYTTKAEKGNTGLGLWKIRDILRKDTSLELYTTKNDNMFKQQLEIYEICG